MQIKVVTFNIRIEGLETFVNRLPLIADKIRYEKPDVICFQELSSEMQNALVGVLDGYFLVGGGRNDDRRGESTAIAFKKNKFLLSNCRTLWLSPTPNVPGSRFTEDQSGCPRVYTMVTLTDADTATTFRVYNTHLDHIGEIARMNGVKQILEDMKNDSETLPYPVIFTGDFNADPDKPEILEVVNSGFLRDITGEYTQTFNAFGKPFKSWDGYKIDYIFVSDTVKCNYTELWNDRPGGKYLSDHEGIMATLEI